MAANKKKTTSGKSGSVVKKTAGKAATAKKTAKQETRRQTGGEKGRPGEETPPAGSESRRRAETGRQTGRESCGQAAACQTGPRILHQQ